MTSTAEIHEN